MLQQAGRMALLNRDRRGEQVLLRQLHVRFRELARLLGAAEPDDADEQSRG